MSPIINGVIVLILGMLVVFLGMIIIICSVSICGKIMNKTSNAPKKEKAIEVPQVQTVAVENEEVPDHVKAAIIAAISAYYFNTKSECDFIVRKIRRF